ncbi:MAG: chemotaxis protein CheZ [Alphaproteobacteria bacterium]|nr:chemotaxis protein CheZ [Alphaproteobacteria bacterium]MEA2975193.1 chemotaxis protein CheZ [Alphaproteobacteria bacterium]
MPEGEAESAVRHSEIMAELRALQVLLKAHEPDGPRTIAPTQTQTANAELFKSELGAIYEAISRTKQEIATLVVTGFSSPDMGRVTHELDAVVVGSESATHRILQAGEEIEEIATTLSAALKSQQDQNLTRDILDHVTRIFEACNFQDLAGQRVTKVIATLKFIEEHILHMMNIWGGIDQFTGIVPAARAERDSHEKLVNGPKLDGESGHVSQDDIDALFPS